MQETGFVERLQTDLFCWQSVIHGDYSNDTEPVFTPLHG